jgi:hypothetical protein
MYQSPEANRTFRQHSALPAVKGSNRSVLQLTKANLSLYIDREKRREKEESRIRGS